MSAGIAAASAWPKVPPSAPVKLSKSPMVTSYSYVVVDALRHWTSRSAGEVSIASGVLFVLGSPDPLPHGVLLAHVSALLRIPVIPVAAEMVDLRIEVCPNNR